MFYKYDGMDFLSFLLLTIIALSAPNILFVWVVKIYASHLKAYEIHLADYSFITKGFIPLFGDISNGIRSID